GAGCDRGWDYLGGAWHHSNEGSAGWRKSLVSTPFLACASGGSRWKWPVTSSAACRHLDQVRRAVGVGHRDDALAAARVWKGAVPDEFSTDDWFDPQTMYARGEEQVSDETSNGGSSSPRT